MKYKLLILGIGIILSVSSCKKYADVAMPDFDATTDSVTVHVGSPITYNFTGDANTIVFWAGDVGRNYEYRNRDTVQGGKPQFKFSSLRLYGFNTGVDTTLQLMVSTDYSGNPTTKDINKANWTNISDRVTWADGHSSTVYTPSGTIDLSDFPKADPRGLDSAVYIAFHYHEIQPATNKRAWYLKEYSVDYMKSDSTLINIAPKTMLWSTVQVQDSLRSWFIYADNSLMWGGPAAYPETEDWLISQPLFLNRVNPDLGTSVKTNPSTYQRTYVFAGYPKAGTYTAVFLATNANRWDIKTVLKKITITVLDN